MHTPLNPSHSPILDLSTLKPGDKVWILSETFKPRLFQPAQRFYAGATDSGLILLSLDSSTFHPIIHSGHMWTRRSGALEELIGLARSRADAANAEVARLEREWCECRD